MEREKLTSGILDFHAHILPGADHGSRSLETSLLQLKLLRDAEVAAVVATPHFYAHEEKSVDSFLAKRQTSAEALLRALPKGETFPSIYLGAEVLVCHGLDKMEGLEKLCIGDSSIILLEMPFTDWGSGLMETVEAIVRRGLTPLMAHIDRYRPDQRALFFETGGIYFQVNASALCLPFVRRSFRRMAKDNLFSAIGSDLHGVPKEGYRTMEKALSYIGRAAADGIRLSSERMLEGATPFYSGT